MKKFQFDDLWILSRKEQRGLGVSFHPHRNLVVGPNHTGKSTLIKTLFTTLWATPAGDLGGWDTQATTAVRLTIGGTKYRIVNDNGHRGLFDSSGTLIAASANADAWAKIFSELTGFSLPLADRKTNQTARANPACYFLPFYIDQDSGWVDGWETFKALKKYSAPVKTIMEYFSGVRPPQYYEAKALFDEAKSAISALDREVVFLEKAQKRFSDRFPENGPKMEASNFEAEISRLSTQMTGLNAAQEGLRQRSTQEADLVSRLDRQISAANAALREYEGDLRYLGSAQSETLVCPVCEAEHSEPYVDLLAFTDDARSLRAMTVTFIAEREKHAAALRQVQGEIRALEGSYTAIEEILRVRRGEVRFGDIVESRGAEHAFQAFVEERGVLDKEIGSQRNVQNRHKAQMERYTDKKRTGEIIARFKRTYAHALRDLNMPDAAIASLVSRPNISGSGGPRAILAYFAALWSVCVTDESTFLNPIVVDSPNQQGQDSQNLPKVLEYVSTKLPAQTQLILGSELDVNHEFDHRIALSRKYQLLDADQYGNAVQELENYTKALYDLAR